MNDRFRQWFVLSMLMVSVNVSCGRWLYDEFMGKDTFNELAPEAACDLLDECGYLDAADWSYKTCVKEFRSEYVCDDGHDMTNASNCYDELIMMTCEDVEQKLNDVAPSCATVCN